MTKKTCPRCDHVFEPQYTAVFECPRCDAYEFDFTDKDLSFIRAGIFAQYTQLKTGEPLKDDLAIYGSWMHDMFHISELLEKLSPKE